MDGQEPVSAELTKKNGGKRKDIKPLSVPPGNRRGR